MSQLADMADVITQSLNQSSDYGREIFLVRLGAKMMESAGYDADEVIWALERVATETAEFTAIRAIREVIEEIRQEEIAARG